MRSTTKSILTVVSIGLVAASYKYGVETYAAQNSQLSSLGGPVVPTEAVTQPTTQESATPTPDPTATAKTPTNTPKATATPKPKPKATKKPSSGSSNSSGSASVTKTGEPIYYNFGTYQVSVTKANGTITAVDLLQGSYTRVPQGTNTWLVQSAIASQGSSFGNISRATYTTMAFKDALDSALAKF